MLRHEAGLGASAALWRHSTAEVGAFGKGGVSPGAV